MKTKFFAVMSVIGVAAFSIVQAPSQPPAPSTVSAGRTSEKATNAERPGGGHGLVRVNTEAGVYHREGSPFYGTTDKGRYMTEQDAIQAGNKRRQRRPKYASTRLQAGRHARAGFSLTQALVIGATKAYCVLSLSLRRQVAA